MITFAESQDLLRSLDVAGRASRTERCDLRAARGRVLAADVRIDRDQPGFDRATMDGYAVVPDGDVAEFDVVATVTAGTSHEGELAPGQAVRIMTGAPAPGGTTVVPVEVTEALDDGQRVRLEAAPAAGRNIAWRGELYNISSMKGGGGQGDRPQLGSYSYFKYRWLPLGNPVRVNLVVMC